MGIAAIVGYFFYQHLAANNAAAADAAATTAANAPYAAALANQQQTALIDALTGQSNTAGAAQQQNTGQVTYSAPASTSAIVAAKPVGTV